jgi:hypothetical protein
MRYLLIYHLATDSEALLQADQENSGFLHFIRTYASVTPKICCRVLYYCINLANKQIVDI